METNNPKRRTEKGERLTKYNTQIQGKKLNERKHGRKKTEKYTRLGKRERQQKNNPMVKKNRYKYG
jgi:hypothetical protein